MGEVRHKINCAVFGYIEHELYRYETTKKELETMRDDILDETPFKETNIRTLTPGDPTYQKASKLITTTAITRMTRTITAIESAMQKLSEDHNQLFEMKYNQHKSWQMITIEMPICRATYFNLRKDIVELVAMEMGLI